MQLPLAYLDATSIEEVPLELWRQLFDVVGWPISSNDESLTHAAILDALERGSPTDDLLLALEAIHELGNEAGREATIEALGDQGLRALDLPEDCSARELAVHLFLRQRTNAALIGVFARAQVRVQEGAKFRRFDEFAGRSSRLVPDLETRRKDLEARMLIYCRENDLGDHVQVKAFDDDDTYIFQVLHSYRTRKPLAVVPGHGARSRIEFRPVHGDILRYKARDGRLQIVARVPSLINHYRMIMGDVLFEDPSFFTGTPAYSLDVFQRDGRAALDSYPMPEIGFARVTEVLWEVSDGNLHQVRSLDCFRHIESLHLPLEAGHFLEIKIKVQIIGRSRRPVTVTIRPPSRMTVSNVAHRDVILRYLEGIGVYNPVPAERKPDLWNSGSEPQPIGVWRLIFGAHTDSLVSSALRAAQRQSVPHPDFTDAGNTLEPVATGYGVEYYGVSRRDDVPSRSLSPTDVEGYRLHESDLARFLSTRLGLAHVPCNPVRGEILDLGILEVEGFRCGVYYAWRPPGSQAIHHLRTVARNGLVVLLVPQGRMLDSDMDMCLAIDDAVPDRNWLVRETLSKLGLGATVDAIHFAPPSAQLVVDTLRQKVWVCGVEVPGLRSNSSAYRFAEILARTGGIPVPTGEIATSLSRASSLKADPTGALRSAKMAAKRAINEALSASGRKPLDYDPFAGPDKGTYQCRLPAFVRE